MRYIASFMSHQRGLVFKLFAARDVRERFEGVVMKYIRVLQQESYQINNGISQFIAHLCTNIRDLVLAA